MKKKGITDFLLNHAGLDPVSFHMPGHKGRNLYDKYGYGEFIHKIIACDITEIQGADNLFQTEGIIKETAEKYKRLYDVKKSYLLINGTSGGLIASILASVPPGGKLIMARNCHKSVFNALTLGNMEPVYAYPDIIKEYGISGAVSPEEIERLLAENSDAEAVILPSPNYYGICSDIGAIAEVVHRAGKILIVDQAHGAHLKLFSSFIDKLSGEAPSVPLPAEELGADIVVNSTHKTLLTLTQSAVLNVNSHRVHINDLEDRLQAVESTSPSYILMASLDINGDILEHYGKKLVEQWHSNIRWFYGHAEKIEGLVLMNVPEAMDPTKINIDMSRYGLDGKAVEKKLLEYNIFAELVTGNILMCMTGIGNTSTDYQRLLTALTEIAGESKLRDKSACKASPRGELWGRKRRIYPVPDKKVLIPLEEAEGRICASSIIPYPPGIPFLCPGEKIGRDEIRHIGKLRAQGEKVIGVSHGGKIWIGR